VVLTSGLSPSRLLDSGFRSGRGLAGSECALGSQGRQGRPGETIGVVVGTAVRMSLQLAPRRVVAPDGVEWCVGRKWMTRRPRLLRRHQSGKASDSLQNLGSVWPDLGGLDLGQELLALAAVVAVVLVLIPVLFFGLELIILGVLLGTSPPWTSSCRGRSRPAVASSSVRTP
jgi:hypothetical protein